MKNMFVFIAVCFLALPAVARAGEDCGPRFRNDGNPGVADLWEPVEVTGSVDYTIGEKDGKPYIRLPVIEKEGVLYKLHLPIPFLREENIRPGQVVTVSGKGRPSAWSRDRSVTVVVFSVETGGVKKTVPWPSRDEHRRNEKDQRL